MRKKTNPAKTSCSIPISEWFGRLDEIGLTQLKAGEGELIKGIRDRFQQSPPEEYP